MFAQDISFDENDVAKVIYIIYRIRSRNLIPEEITSFLGIQPTKFYSKGETYLGKTFDPLTKSIIDKERSRPNGLWDLDSRSIQTTSRRVEDHIKYLLAILEPHNAQIIELLEHRERFDVSFYIRWEPISGHGTYVISNTLLRRMSDLCHFVEFCFLSKTENETE